MVLVNNLATPVLLSKRDNQKQTSFTKPFNNKYEFLL